MRKPLARETVARYRRRARQRGLVRAEVILPREDVESVRSLAALLREAAPAEIERLRGELRALVRAASGTRLKELLASAPLEGVDLERSRDPGRTPDLP